MIIDCISSVLVDMFDSDDCWAVGVDANCGCISEPDSDVTVVGPGMSVNVVGACGVRFEVFTENSLQNV